jgi:hypothetical protein
VQPKGYITPRESGRERDVRHFLPRSLVTRKFDKPSRERKQMTAGYMALAGAPSSAQCPRGGFKCVS